jgi:hypothetical protein
MDGASSPSYAEWEAAEARRIERIGRLDNRGGVGSAGGGEEQLQFVGNQSATESTGSSGSEGTSPVRSSYGRYLLARRALLPQHLGVRFCVGTSPNSPLPLCRA